jgi:predicted metal-dependent hydrolase
MSEKWEIECGGEPYTCLVTYKKMRTLRFRFAPDGKTLLVSAPYGVPERVLKDDIGKYLPRLAKQASYEKPIDGDEVYLFGKKSTIPGFAIASDEERKRYLSDMLTPVLRQRVGYYSGRMGIQTSYKIRVRDMTSRYGVNSKRTQALTFALSLVHYSVPEIDSVVVHELAHYFRFDH